MSAALALLAATTPLPTYLPSDSWRVDLQENICALEHDYLTAAGRLTISFAPLFNSDHMDVVVLVPDRSSGLRVGILAMTFGPHGERFEAGYRSLRNEGASRRFYRASIDKKAWDALVSADSVAVDTPSLRATLPLPDTAPARAELTACQNKLLSSWGVTPATVDPNRAPKLRNVRSAFIPSDYPIESLRNGLSGRVIALLQVDADGAVSGCRVVVGFTKAFNDATCAGGLRARFDPAHDEHGRPIASVYVLPVRWVR